MNEKNVLEYQEWWTEVSDMNKKIVPKRKMDKSFVHEWRNGPARESCGQKFRTCAEKMSQIEKRTKSSFMSEETVPGESGGQKVRT